MKTTVDNKSSKGSRAASEHIDQAARANHSISAQQSESQSIDSSPRQTAQARQIAQLSGDELQRQAEPEEEELMQGKFEAAQRQGAPDEEELMQGKFHAVQRQAAPEEDELMQGKLQSSAPASMANNTGIPPALQANLESTFSRDFSNVKLHKDSSKATEVSALAFTQGNDIHFAPGQFQPDTAKGRQLLGHEAAHVVQQSEGRVKPTTEVAGLPVNDDVGLEKEADVLGAKFRG